MRTRPINIIDNPDKSKETEKWRKVYLGRSLEDLQWRGRRSQPPGIESESLAAGGTS